MAKRNTQPLTDLERLDRLERLLRSRDELHELWFDADAKLFCAGDQIGDTFRDALDQLLAKRPRGGLRKGS